MKILLVFALVSIGLGNLNHRRLLSTDQGARVKDCFALYIDYFTADTCKDHPRDEKAIIETIGNCITLLNEKITQSFETLQSVSERRPRLSEIEGTIAQCWIHYFKKLTNQTYDSKMLKQCTKIPVKLMLAAGKGVDYMECK